MSNLTRPDSITSWTWYDAQNHADLELWQNCLMAAHLAEAKDVHATATRIYKERGGVLKTGLTRRQKSAENRAKKRGNV